MIKFKIRSKIGMPPPSYPFKDKKKESKKKACRKFQYSKYWKFINRNMNYTVEDNVIPLSSRRSLKKINKSY